MTDTHFLCISRVIMAEEEDEGRGGTGVVAAESCHLSSYKSKIQLHEVYFFPLRNQSNIYGLLNLHIKGCNKLVVTTLPGEVYSLEFHNPLVQRPPSFKPLTFSYIPGMVLSVACTIVMVMNFSYRSVEFIFTELTRHYGEK